MAYRCWIMDYQVCFPSTSFHFAWKKSVNCFLSRKFFFLRDFKQNAFFLLRKMLFFKENDFFFWGKCFFFQGKCFFLSKAWYTFSTHPRLLFPFWRILITRFSWQKAGRSKNPRWHKLELRKILFDTAGNSRSLVIRTWRRKLFLNEQRLCFVNGIHFWQMVNQ